MGRTHLRTPGRARESRRSRASRSGLVGPQGCRRRAIRSPRQEQSMYRLLTDTLLATAETAFELAARTIDLAADCGNRRTIAALEHRLRAVERRLADAEREVEASRRVD